MKQILVNLSEGYPEYMLRLKHFPRVGGKPVSFPRYVIQFGVWPQWSKGQGDIYAMYRADRRGKSR